MAPWVVHRSGEAGRLSLQGTKETVQSHTRVDLEPCVEVGGYLGQSDLVRNSKMGKWVQLRLVNKDSIGTEFQKS